MILQLVFNRIIIRHLICIKLTHFLLLEGIFLQALDFVDLVAL